MSTAPLEKFRSLEFKLQDKIQNDKPLYTESHLYDEVLKIVGLGRIHWLLLLASGLLLMMFLNETTGMSIILLASQCDLKTNSEQKAWISSGTYLGILFSSYFWGYLTDTLGRRKILIFATLAGNIFSLISMFMPSLWSFLVARVFVGIFIAVASSGTYAYLGEFFLPQHRPVVLNVASTFNGISHAFIPLCGWLVLSMNWRLYLSDSFVFRPWRLLIFLNCLPGLIAVSILLYLPESPKFLLSNHQDDKAFALLDWVCKKNTGRYLADFKVFKVRLPEEDKQQLMENEDLTIRKSCAGIFQQMWKDTVPLFKPPHVLYFLLCCAVVFGAVLTCTGVALWFPQIENTINAGSNSQTVCKVIDASQKAELMKNETSTVCDDTVNPKTFIATGVMGVVHILVYIGQSLLINRVGRKNLVIVVLTISGLFGISLNWVSQPTALLICLMLFLVLPGPCSAAIIAAIIDLVPTQLRGKAVCIAYIFGRVGGITGLNVMGDLFETHCVATFSAVSALLIVCAAITIAIPI